MASTPAWLTEPEEAAPASSTTSKPLTDEALPNWATNDVEQPEQPQAANMQVVEVDGPKAASPTASAVTTSTTATGSAAEAASSKTWGQYFGESFRRDGRLLLITLGIIILMNIPFVKWLLYPFTIFSTWIHELCHGLAAVLAGGHIAKLEIFPDTSGLAYTAVSHNRKAFVASAGYQGTAVVGCLLLLIRRTKRGPRTGTMAIAVMMILSVLFWIRNAFGIVFIFLMGLATGFVAWRLPSNHMRNFYIILAVTCCMNAITSVQNLFGSNHSVNGQESSTDAHTMADIKGGTNILWAMIWLILALLLTLAGIMFAIPGPDEVADFTCCGICQDLGIFQLCNYPGQRLFRRALRASTNSNNDDNN